ncbi:MAG: DNA replication and repair protein RecF [Chitinophagaceae bacterium]|nr:MAG: DNA replication and repair protein RecF [Chitinophagaceae bacterium]
MLFLKSISLVQFKNYPQRQFDFEKRIICITGNNGMGKTNLLDAIYYLCFAKSYFNSQELLNISHDYEGFRIAGVFLKNEKEESVECIYKNGKKELILNGTAYTRFSRHLGHFPAVIVAPDDAVIINGGGEQRRRFVDTILTQIDTAYLDHLIAYQKILQQRNGLLRNTPAGKMPDEALLHVFDEQLSLYGNAIFEKRKTFLPLLAEKVNYYYHQISDEREDIKISYQSNLLQTRFQDLLLQNHRRDVLLQRTTEGIHRDNLLFFLNDYPAKQTASQGQRKNFLFALKLAQYDILREYKSFSPLLLLDDLFEKLDHSRISRLISLIGQPDFGQVFITDTEEERLKKIWGEETSQLQFVKL